MQEFLAKIEHFLGSHPGMTTAFWIALLLVAALVVFVCVRLIVSHIARRLLDGAKHVSERDILEAGIISRLAAATPAVLIASLIHQVPGVSHGVASTVERIAIAFIILAIAWAGAATCRLLGRLWQRRIGTGRTVTGFVQVAVITVYVIAAALILAVLIHRSPLIVISSLGALTAVLVLVFKDTLLSLVASLEIASTNFVRVGDWIEMPEMNANGTVEDFSLYTVQVRNFDKTYTNFPTCALVSQSYKNWRGMTESGGRRIERAIVLDQATVRFVTEDEFDRYAALPGLADPIATARQGAAGGDGASPVRPTNSSLFRAYVLHHLNQSALIRKDMTLMVRQLAPGPFGLPLQVYCFTNTTVWADYETIQADLFDHLLGMLPQFDLAVFQSLDANPPGKP
jgi:miniconductance mechanosensitive channel